MPTTDFPSTAPFIADADACTHAAQRESWRQRSLMKLAALKAATPATPLLELSLRGLGEARILIKDERAHASGSLKHRLAMSLFEQALQQDWLTPDCPVIEASSGSTAVSEAWLARRLGLQFIAVVPRGTAFYKQEAIRGEGGRVVESRTPLGSVSMRRRLPMTAAATSSINSDMPLLPATGQATPACPGSA